MSGAEEGLLVAELDLEDCVQAKLVHDYSGHYNRADIFTLTVNRAVPGYLQTVAEPQDLASAEREEEPQAMAEPPADSHLANSSGEAAG